MTVDLTAIFGGLFLLVLTPAVVLTFVYKYKSKIGELEIKKIREQKEVMAMEIEKQKNQIKLLEEENRKYDQIIILYG
jgi:hypothetical protein